MQSVESDMNKSIYLSKRTSQQELSNASHAWRCIHSGLSLHCIGTLMIMQYLCIAVAQLHS